MTKIVYLFCVVIFTFSSAIAQNKSGSSKYRILTYGLPDLGRRNASGIIENKWNIEIYPVAGCIITNELEDSVKRENNKTYQFIEAKYGKDWEQLFDEEIEAEYKIEMQIDSLIKKQAFIEDKEIINPWPGAPFPMSPVDDKGNYIVKISTYNRNWEEQKLYDLRVNYRTNTVKIIKDYTGKK